MPIVPISRPAKLAANVPPAVISRPEINPRSRTRTTPPAEAAAVTTAAVTPSGPPAPRPGDDDYTGFGCPPKRYQFKPGQSGNPKGRPKGAKGMKTIAREVLTEKVSVRTPKGVKRISKMEAMIHKKAELGFGGNLRAIDSCGAAYQLAVPDEVPDGGGSGPGAAPTFEQLDDVDRATLDALKMMLLAEMGGQA